MGPKYILHYFDVPGRGEIMRLMFHHKGVEFEDHRISFADWPAWQKNAPHDTLPVLDVVVDGKSYHLSEAAAIARYLATTMDLSGKDAKDNFRVDSAVDKAQELWGALSPWFQAKDEDKPAVATKLRTEVMPAKLDRLAQILKLDQQKFILGDQLTWGDFFIVVTIGAVESLVFDHKDYDNKDLVAYKGRIMGLKGVKEYMDSKKK